MPVPDDNSSVNEAYESLQRDTLRKAMEVVDVLDDLVEHRSGSAAYIPVLKFIWTASAFKESHIALSRLTARLLMNLVRNMVDAGGDDDEDTSGGINLSINDTQAVCLSFQTLMNFSYSLDPLLRMGESGILLLSKLVLEKLDSPNDKSVQATNLAAIKLMVNLTCQSHLRKPAIDVDFLTIIADILRRWSHDADMLKEAVRCVVNLSFEPNLARKIESSSILQAIRDAMKATHRPDFIYECMRALYNLSFKNPICKDLMLDVGLIPVIFQNLASNTSNDNVLLYAFQALANLAVGGEEFRKAIRNEGSASIVSDAKRLPNAKLYIKASEFEDLLMERGGFVAGVADVGTVGGGQVQSYALRRALPIGFVIRTLEKRVQAAMQLGDLLIFVPFLVCSFIFIIGNRIGGEDSFYVLEGMRNQIMGNEFATALIEKRFLDIANNADWYDWLHTVQIPSLWPVGQEEGGFGRFPIGQSMLIGSMRIRTLRVNPDSCSVNAAMYPDFNGPDALPDECFDIYTATGVNTQRTPHVGYNFSTCEQTGERALTGDELYNCNGHVIDIQMNGTKEYALQISSQLREVNFVDNEKTRLILVEFFAYSPQFDAFGSYKLFNEVKGGGTWWAENQLRQFRVWTLGDLPMTIYNGCFAIFVAYYIFWFIHEFRREMRIHHTRPARYLFQFWNIVEFSNLLCYVVVFVLKLYWILLSRNCKVNFLDPAYPDCLENVLFAYSFSTYVNSVNCLLSVMKSLKYVQMNDNLNLLTRTISKCRQGVMGVLIVFIFILMAFTISGNFLFGTGLSDFRNFNTTFSTLLRMLVGDFDYEAMREENRFASGLYFSVYMLLGLFLYLNFIIAIISDAFAEVNADTVIQTIDKQMEKTWQEMQFQVSSGTCAQRLSLIYQKKTLSKVLRMVLDECLVPWRHKKKAKLMWKNLASYVKARAARRAKGINMKSVAIEAASRSENVDDSMFLYSEFKALIPASKYALLGDVFFNDTWEELIWEYDLTRAKPKELEGDQEQTKMSACAHQQGRILKNDITNIHARWCKLLKQSIELKNLMAASISKKAQTKYAPKTQEAMKNFQASLKTSTAFGGLSPNRRSGSKSPKSNHQSPH